MPDITFEEAVERAREFLGWSFDLLGHSKADFEAFRYTLHEEFGEVDDPDARIQIATDHLRNGDHPSAELRTFVADTLEKLKPSKVGKKFMSRDMAICNAVCLIALEGFTPTRAKAKGKRASAKGGSACDAVGVALERLKQGSGYDNVERIWSATEPKAHWRAVLAAAKIK